MPPCSLNPANLKCTASVGNILVTFKLSADLSVKNKRPGLTLMFFGKKFMSPPAEKVLYPLSRSRH